MFQTVTTYINSKTTCITHIDTGINSLRIDLLDETIDEINHIAEAASKGNKLEGKQYTYGNLNRDVWKQKGRSICCKNENNGDTPKNPKTWTKRSGPSCCKNETNAPSPLFLQ